MHRLKSIIRRTPFVLIQNQCRRHLLKGLFTVFGYVVPSVVADQHEVIAIEQSRRQVLSGNSWVCGVDETKSQSSLRI